MEERQWQKKGVVRKCGCARNQVWAVPALVSVRLPGRALHALLQLGIGGVKERSAVVIDGVQGRAGGLTAGTEGGRQCHLA